MQKRFEALHVEVEKRDQDIRQLQRSLKEIENILASIFLHFYIKIFLYYQVDY